MRKDKPEYINEQLKKFKRFLFENSLSITLILLFVCFLLGQYFTGYSTFNAVQRMYRLPTVNHSQYFKSGHFLDGVFANWQAAILQLGSLIVFSVFLVQRGATPSKEPRKHAKKIKGVKPFKKVRVIIHENSLSLAFAVLFLIAFYLHVIFSHKLANHNLELAHMPTITIGKYFLSANFWFLTLQTWQTEYMAIALYIILSIFLRQSGSPESKPTEAKNQETGKANK